MEQHAGGWTIDPAVNKEFKPISAELLEIFEEAFKGLVGAAYKPLLYCGSQIVAGTNYLFICEQKLVIPDADKHIAAVTLYQSLPPESKVVITRIENII